MRTPSLYIGRELKESTRQWLMKQSVRFIEQPLIKIGYNMPNLKKDEILTDTCKQWVVTSSYAVKWLVKFRNHVGFKKDDLVFCLSARQASIAKIFTDNIFISEKANAISLAELLLKENKNETIIYIKGDKSSNIIAKAVEAVGKEIKELEVYRNDSIGSFVDKEFETYLFFSPSGIESFVQAGIFLPQSATIVAIGVTTATFASKVFQKEVLISPKQDELSMVKYALTQLKDGSKQTV